MWAHKNQLVYKLEWQLEWHSGYFCKFVIFFETRKNRLVHELAISFYDHLSWWQLRASGGSGPKCWNHSWLLCLICFTPHIWSMSRKHILVSPLLTSALNCCDSGLDYNISLRLVHPCPRAVCSQHCSQRSFPKCTLLKTPCDSPSFCEVQIPFKAGPLPRRHGTICLTRISLFVLDLTSGTARHTGLPWAHSCRGAFAVLCLERPPPWRAARQLLSCLQWGLPSLRYLKLRPLPSTTCKANPVLKVRQGKLLQPVCQRFLNTLISQWSRVDLLPSREF